MSSCQAGLALHGDLRKQEVREILPLQTGAIQKVKPPEHKLDRLLPFYFGENSTKIGSTWNSFPRCARPEEDRSVACGEPHKHLQETPYQTRLPAEQSTQDGCGTCFGKGFYCYFN